MKKLAMKAPLYLLITCSALPISLAASIQIDSIDHSLEQGISANPLLQSPATATNTNTAGTLVIDTSKKHQTFAGIGAAFSEIGGLALAGLPEAIRDALLTSLFDPVKGAGFSMCRLPVGSSDFATNAYSYADTPWDLGMNYFTLDRDKKSIIPAAQGSLKKNPALRFFASPWSPPAWMKTTGRMDGGGKTNNLFDLDEIYKAYSLYFVKYIKGYGTNGITISRLCPQNEMDASPGYPGCVMPPPQMTKLVVNYLAPAFKNEGISTEIWPGTFRESPKTPWAAECMKNEPFRKAISGLGIQYYNGKTIQALADTYPDLRFMYTEANCCGGKNTAKEAQAHFREVIGAFLTGCDTFAYWNMILDENQSSGWKWKQNSLVTIDRPTSSVRYNPDYQSIYLISRAVHPGDVRVDANWSNARNGDLASQAAAFLKPDGSVVTLIQNAGPNTLNLKLSIDGKDSQVTVPSHSDNSILIKQ